jgi:hypothetical protein
VTGGGVADAMEISLSGACGVCTRGDWRTGAGAGAAAVGDGVCGGSCGGSGVLAQAASSATSPRPLSTFKERVERRTRTGNEEGKVMDY